MINTGNLFKAATRIKVLEFLISCFPNLWFSNLRSSLKYREIKLCWTSINDDGSLPCALIPILMECYRISMQKKTIYLEILKNINFCQAHSYIKHTYPNTFIKQQNFIKNEFHTHHLASVRNCSGNTYLWKRSLA